MQRNIGWSMLIGLLVADRTMSVRATSNRKGHLMTGVITPFPMSYAACGLG